MEKDIFTEKESLYKENVWVSLKEKADLDWQTSESAAVIRAGIHIGGGHSPKDRWDPALAFPVGDSEY